MKCNLLSQDGQQVNVPKDTWRRTEEVEFGRLRKSWGELKRSIDTQLIPLRFRFSAVLIRCPFCSINLLCLYFSGTSQRYGLVDWAGSGPVLQVHLPSRSHQYSCAAVFVLMLSCLARPVSSWKWLMNRKNGPGAGGLIKRWNKERSWFANKVPASANRLIYVHF